MGTDSGMITLSGHLCASLHVGNARRSRSVLNYRITVPGSPDLIHSLICMSLLRRQRNRNDPSDIEAIQQRLAAKRTTKETPLVPKHFFPWQHPWSIVNFSQGLSDSMNALKKNDLLSLYEWPLLTQGWISNRNSLFNSLKKFGYTYTDMHMYSYPSIETVHKCHFWNE